MSNSRAKGLNRTIREQRDASLLTEHITCVTELLEPKYKFCTNCHMSTQKLRLAGFCKLESIDGKIS